MVGTPKKSVACVALHRVEHRVGIEARQQQRRRARLERAVQRHAEAVHVEERQRVHEAVVGRPAPGEAQRLGGGVQVAVREQRPLRPPGGARGVGEQRGRLGRDAVERGHRAVAPARARARARAARDRAPRAARRAPSSSTSAARGRASAEQLRELGGPVGGVRGQHDEAEPQAGDVGHRERERARRAHEHALARAQARRVRGAPPRAPTPPRAGPTRAAPPALVGEGRPLRRRAPVGRPGGRQRARSQASRLEGRARRQVHAPARSASRPSVEPRRGRARAR